MPSVEFVSLGPAKSTLAVEEPPDHHGKPEEGRS
jgi:hypothetical protein